MSETLIKVKTDADCSKLTGSIISAYESNPRGIIKLRVIGAGALNQAIKSVVGSKKHFSPKNMSVTLDPYFVDVENTNPRVEREKITAVEFIVIIH